jgi:hypothetical protein
LQETPPELQPPCFGLSLSWPLQRREAGDVRFLSRFRPLFEGDRRMQVLELRGAPLVPCAAVDGQELDRHRRLFFCDLVPKHPHLRTLILEDCRVSASYLEGFVSAALNGEKEEVNSGSSLTAITSVATNRLRCLEFRRTKLDPQAVRELCRLLEEHGPTQPRAVRIEHLRLESCGLSTESCDLLLRALRHNRTLRSFVIERNYVHDISDEAAQAVESNTTLQALVMEEPMLGLLPEQDGMVQPNPNAVQHAEGGGTDAESVAASEGAASASASASSSRKFRSTEPVRRLARAVRSHPSLQILHVPVSEGRSTAQPHPFEELLEHNFVLRDVKAGYEFSAVDPVQQRVHNLLDRNRPYQDLLGAGMVLDTLPAEAWPGLLEQISPKPEWLWSFLRHPGNVPTLARTGSHGKSSAKIAPIDETVIVGSAAAAANNYKDLEVDHRIRRAQGIPWAPHASKPLAAPPAAPVTIERPLPPIEECA